MEHIWCRDLHNFVKLMVLEIIMFYFDPYYFEENMFEDASNFCLGQGSLKNKANEASSPSILTQDTYLSTAFGQADESY
jgi:hypothetical protein